MRLLLIEDDEILNRLISTRLTDAGFEVVAASGGQEGLQLAFQVRPDLVILDIMMPGMDGWETCRQLRQMTDVPILILTARGAEEDVIRGLLLGADDFVRKPFSFRELELRIAAILRRAKTGPGEEPDAIYDDGNLRIDLERRMVFRAGQPVHLTPTELSLLMYLVSRPDQVSSHGDILRTVWGPEYEQDTAILTVYIRYLREKIENDPGRPRYIVNERGIGYRFARNDAEPI